MNVKIVTTVRQHTFYLVQDQHLHVHT